MPTGLFGFNTLQVFLVKSILYLCHKIIGDGTGAKFTYRQMVVGCTDF
jgi:hypothetical protein